jgi:asparagine synthase (glutamine-hydrolysing)
MCGIAGVMGANDAGLAGRMIERIIHRGPDDGGVWASAADGPLGCALGSRRLAIQDLSPAGHMPMRTEDGRFVIVLNGEIYNFRDIRTDLEAVGERFRSSGDTEVALKALRRWGVDALQRFNGMFALALWDDEAKELLLARDRLGEKPVYFTENGGRFLFASEAKCLFAQGGVEAALAPEYVSLYLKQQFISGDATMFRGVTRLRPAHWLKRRAGHTTMGRYWRADARRDAPGPEEVDALVAEAVRSRLISDVPVGLFLSGGVDSGVTSAAAAPHLPHAIAYTLRFEPPAGADPERFDESAHAAATAKRLGLEHRFITCGVDDAVDLMPRLVQHLDEPIADSLLLPFFVLCREARGAFTVALSGEGADETFAGYRFYTLEATRRRLRHSGFGAGLDALGHWARGAGLSDDVRRRAAALVGAPSALDGFIAWQGCFSSDREIAALFPDAPRFAADRQRAMLLEAAPGAEERDPRLLAPYLDLHNRLPDFILTVRDRMSMASSLELRTPFHDHRLVEAALALPAERLIRGRITKAELRRTAQGLLGDLAAQRPKVPFSAPVKAWGRALAERYLLEGGSLIKMGLLDPAAARALVDNVDRRAQQLWSVLILELWAQAFLGAANSAPSGLGWARGGPVRQDAPETAAPR